MCWEEFMLLPKASMHRSVCQLQILKHFRSYLYSIEPLNGLRLNIAVDDDGKSFYVLDIKVRNKIVADGINDPAFDMANRGRYVNAEQFNQSDK